MGIFSKQESCLNSYISKETSVVPVIICALRSVPHNLRKYLDMLKIEYDMNILQRSVLLGTANILQKFTGIDKDGGMWK